ncbi:hypothetical protein B0H14DRAFT_3719281 [Mycena olivaceomarginata]|nr:hypothetical protein B0H14DRAFT_3719281 [Mycena olivaceomarginata]
MPLAARPRCLTCGRVSTVVLPALVLDALQGCFAPTGGGREKPEEAPAVRFRCEFGAESASCAEDEDNASSVSSFAKSSSHFSVVSWEERCRTCACVVVPILRGFCKREVCWPIRLFGFDYERNRPKHTTGPFYAIVCEEFRGVVASNESRVEMQESIPRHVCTWAAPDWPTFTELWALDCQEFHDTNLKISRRPSLPSPPRSTRRLPLLILLRPPCLRSSPPRSCVRLRKTVRLVLQPLPRELNAVVGEITPVLPADKAPPATVAAPLIDVSDEEERLPTPPSHSSGPSSTTLRATARASTRRSRAWTAVSKNGLSSAMNCSCAMSDSNVTVKSLLCFTYAITRGRYPFSLLVVKSAEDVSWGSRTPPSLCRRCFAAFFFPTPKLSVLGIAVFTLPPMSASPEDYSIPAGHDFFSEDGNHSDLDLLSEIKLVAEARQKYLDGAESITIPWTGTLSRIQKNCARNEEKRMVGVQGNLVIARAMVDRNI